MLKRIKKVLIANRGEIACRVIRTCKKLGIQTVAIYSEADAGSMHVTMADEAYPIGPSASRESYLKGDTIIAVAKSCGAQAIHPGYGFLSENADFADACLKSEMLFIGPPATAIRAMGSKSHAKSLMEKANVPLVPGYHEQEQDLKTLQKAADKIGYPLLIKPTAGGGGKGMRVVHQSNDFEEALNGAKREALANFGDNHVLLERFLKNPRHVEIQIFADTHGNVVHLFERDCSIQRRHQKIIEEAPAPGLSEDLRKKMGETAIKAARVINYVGAGTIEFLLDQDFSFYFMEMNTRLQVEHPVTEMITRQDLVEWQLRVAAGEPLPVKQEDLTIQGHAFEVRLYAEDPEHEFLPSCGLISYLKTPKESTHVRIDSGIRENDTITPFYDPMIAKLIVWDDSRQKALTRMRQCLSEYQVVGIRTNVNLLISILENTNFAHEKISTHFIADHYNEIYAAMNTLPEKVIAITSLFQLLKRQNSIHQFAIQSEDPYSPWSDCDNWQIEGYRHEHLYFKKDEKKIDVEIQCSENKNNSYNIINFSDLFPAQHWANKNNTTITVTGKLIEPNQIHFDITNLSMDTSSDSNQTGEATIIECNNETHLFLDKHYSLKNIDPLTSHEFDSETESQLIAPMPGKIVALNVTAGEIVETGASLLVMEAMKMEHTIRAPSKGIVKQFFYKVGDGVVEGVELLEFEPVE
jgi:3-methylcrotonyl-CoA carboxylase alpha subunit